MSRNDVIYREFLRFVPELEQNKKKYPRQEKWDWFIFRMAYEAGWAAQRSEHNAKLLKTHHALREANQRIKEYEEASARH